MTRLDSATWTGRGKSALRYIRLEYRGWDHCELALRVGNRRVALSWSGRAKG